MTENEESIQEDMPPFPIESSALHGHPGYEASWLKTFLGSGPVSDLIYKFTGVFVAGGAVRDMVEGNGVPPADFDIFFTTKGPEMKTLVQYLENQGLAKIFECPDGLLASFRYGAQRIQVINPRPYESVEQILGSFDFRCTMFATDGATLYQARGAAGDVQQRRLVVNSVPHPIPTLKRIAKYGAKGYELGGSHAERIVDAIVDAAEAGVLDGRFYLD